MSSAALIAQALTAPPEVQPALFHLAQGEAIRESIRSCTRCPLHESAKSPVPFYGSPSPVALIGEAPGAAEDNLGIPFVGRSGHLIDSILSSLSLLRSQFAILNTICCRPPGNKFDQAISVDAPRLCTPNFEAQLSYLGSWCLVLFGSQAISKFLPATTVRAAREAGPSWHKGYYIIPTYHPAYALRNPEAKPLIANDLRFLPALLAGEYDTPVPKGYDPTSPVEFLRHSSPLVGLDRKAVLDSFKRRGYVVVHSHYLADTIVVTRDDMVWPESKHAHLPRYTLAEVERLRRVSSQAQLRRIHLLKRELGAEVAV